MRQVSAVSAWAEAAQADVPALDVRCKDARSVLLLFDGGGAAAGGDGGLHTRGAFHGVHPYSRCTRNRMASTVH